MSVSNEHYKLCNGLAYFWDMSETNAAISHYTYQHPDWMKKFTEALDAATLHYLIQQIRVLSNAEIDNITGVPLDN